MPVQTGTHDKPHNDRCRECVEVGPHRGHPIPKVLSCIPSFDGMTLLVVRRCAGCSQLSQQHFVSAAAPLRFHTGRFENSPRTTLWPCTTWPSRTTNQGRHVFERPDQIRLWWNCAVVSWFKSALSRRYRNVDAVYGTAIRQIRLGPWVQGVDVFRRTGHRPAALVGQHDATRHIVRQRQAQGDVTYRIGEPHLAAAGKPSLMILGSLP